MTANKPLLTASKSIEEHLKASDIRTDVKDSITAKKLLLSHGLVLPTACNAIKQVAQALLEFSIAAILGATHSEILRAMAILLLEAEQNLDATILIDKITSLIEGPLALLEDKAEAIAEITETHKAALESAVLEVRDQLYNSSEGIERAVINASLIPTQQRDPDTMTVKQPEGLHTYANAVRANAPPLLTKILARSEAQTRQILIDRRSLDQLTPLKALTEAELVAKATITIELLRKEGKEVPQDLSFLSARRLPHGGILYELNSTQSAKWFQTPSNRSTFINFFGNDVTIKDRSFHILVENVPIAYDPNSASINGEIEKKGGLKHNSITKAKWIKPIARRIPNQRTAHAIITLNSKEDANQILRFGLSIEGKKVYGRKLLPEPTRCLKCHSFDGRHVAAECTLDHDICGTCGAQHRTSTCRVDDPNFHHCVNCDSQGHAAWSRNCPTFVEKWESYKNRSNDANYRYFPTEDPLTWETTSSNDVQHNAQPTEEAWFQPETDLNTHGNHGQQQRQEGGRKHTNHRHTKQQNLNTKPNPNRIPLGSQGCLTDNWLGTRQQPLNKTSAKNPTATPSTRMHSYEPSPTPEDQSTPLWFPPDSPAPQHTPSGSTPTPEFA